MKKTGYFPILVLGLGLVGFNVSSAAGASESRSIVAIYVGVLLLANSSLYFAMCPTALSSGATASFTLSTTVVASNLAVSLKLLDFRETVGVFVDVDVCEFCSKLPLTRFIEFSTTALYILSISFRSLMHWALFGSENADDFSPNRDAALSAMVSFRSAVNCSLSLPLSSNFGMSIISSIVMTYTLSFRSVKSNLILLILRLFSAFSVLIRSTSVSAYCLFVLALSRVLRRNVNSDILTCWVDPSGFFKLSLITSIFFV